MQSETVENQHGVLRDKETIVDEIFGGAMRSGHPERSVHTLYLDHV